MSSSPSARVTQQGTSGAPQPRGTVDPNPGFGREPSGIDRVTLLQAIQDFQAASLELIAWEFSLPNDAIRAQWEACIAEQLIVSAGTDELTGETLYALTELGTAAQRP